VVLVVQEPLALVSITRYFETHHGLTIDGNIEARLQDDQGTGFEEVVLLALTEPLQDGPKLKDIFEFHCPIPKWANLTARIVTRTSTGAFENFDSIHARPKLPTIGVAFYAKNLEDIKTWLESGGADWCVPGTLMGPDLMAWVQLSNGKRLLLVIQAKCHSWGNIDTLRAEATAGAIRSLIPKRFFAPKVCK